METFIARLSCSPELRLSTRRRRVRRLADVLQSLDDRALTQIGIERCEIERFAQADTALQREPLLPKCKPSPKGHLP